MLHIEHYGRTAVRKSTGEKTMVVNRGVEVRDVLSQLETIPFFEGLDREQLIDIKDRSFIRKYRNNEVIIYENEPCVGLFIFLSGSAKIFKTSKDGREQVLYFLGAGDSFGEVPIFDGGGNPITLLATEDSYVMIIEKDDFRKIATENPLVALRTIESLSRRVRKLFSLVEDLSFNDVGKRLARLILDMAEEKGSARGKSIVIEMNMTHQEIAAIVGTVREMVSRSLKKLEKSHIIRSSTGEMEVLDMDTGLNHFNCSIRSTAFHAFTRISSGTVISTSRSSSDHNTFSRVVIFMLGQTARSLTA